MLLKVPQDERTRIADLVLKGLSYPDTVECSGLYLNEYEIDSEEETEPSYEYRACFWGLAFCGLYNTASEAYLARDYAKNAGADTVEFFCEKIGVDKQLFNFLESLNLGERGKSFVAEEIADKLKKGEALNAEWVESFIPEIL